MNKNNIKVNVRGIRNQDDYKYETTMERFTETFSGIGIYIARDF